MSSKNKLTSVSQTSKIIIHFMFAVYTLLCVLPLVLVVIISFTDDTALTLNGYSFFPAKLSLEAYRYTFARGAAILHAYLITIIVTIIGTLSSVLIISLYAYPLSRIDFKYRKGFTLFVVFTMLFNGGMVPWFLVCTQVLHLRNTIFALILPYLVNGFYIIIMRTFFMTSIPHTIIEAAKIDGAGEFRIFFTIVTRMALPGVATIALFVMIAYWNDWWLPMMLIDEDKFVNLQFLMYRVQQNITYLSSGMVNNSNATEQLAKMPIQATRMAMAVLAVGPMVLTYPFFQRFFVKGLTIGAVKG